VQNDHGCVDVSWKMFMLVSLSSCWCHSFLSIMGVTDCQALEVRVVVFDALFWDLKH